MVIITYDGPNKSLSGPDYLFKAGMRWVFRMRQTWVGDIDGWMERYRSDQNGSLEKWYG